MVRVLYYSDVTTLKKGSWSPEEDQKLKAYIKRYGIWNWAEMPKAAGLSRSGKSCRLRWVNYLKPGIKRGNISCEEEETILRMHKMLGNRWSAIAEKLPGRTDNEIKNYWHTKLSKLRDNPAPRTKSKAPKTSTVEAKLTGSPKAGSSMGSEHPWSPQISIDDSSSSITSFVDKKIQLEGNSSDPMSTQPYAYDSSPSITIPAVETDKNQMMEGSMESARTFGDLQAFPAEDSYELGDYFWETWPDLEVAFPICEEWVQEPPWTYGSCNDNFWLNLYVEAEIGGS